MEIEKMMSAVFVQVQVCLKVHVTVMEKLKIVTVSVVELLSLIFAVSVTVTVFQMVSVIVTGNNSIALSYAVVHLKSMNAVYVTDLVSLLHSVIVLDTL